MYKELLNLLAKDVMLQLVLVDACKYKFVV